MVHLEIEIFNSPLEAPNYNKEENVIACEFKKAVIVRNGTTKGKSTVGIILIDKNGNKYIAMTTGKLVSMLTKAVGDEND